MDRSPSLPPVVEAMVADYSHDLVFWLNGRKVIISDPDPSLMLTDYLRESGLTGTKVGCARAVAACTVMLSTRNPEGPQHAINACLRPLRPWPTPTSLRSKASAMSMTDSTPCSIAWRSVTARNAAIALPAS